MDSFNIDGPKLDTFSLTVVYTFKQQAIESIINACCTTNCKVKKIAGKDSNFHYLFHRLQGVSILVCFLGIGMLLQKFHFEYGTSKMR